MLSEADLRDRLAAAAAAAPPPPDLAAPAIVQGRRMIRRRRWATLAGSAAGVLGVTVAASVLVNLRPSAERADAATVTCLGNRTVLAQPVTSAGPGGAAFTVVNDTSSALQFNADGLGAFVPPGRSQLVLPLAPGVHRVQCGDGASAPQVTVVDDGHIYTPAQLPCPAPVLRNYGRGGRVQQGDPVMLTARLFRVPARDVHVIGYPASTARTLAEVRGGRIVRTATWHQLVAADLWTLGVVQHCP